MLVIGAGADEGTGLTDTAAIGVTAAAVTAEIAACVVVVVVAGFVVFVGFELGPGRLVFLVVAVVAVALTTNVVPMGEPRSVTTSNPEVVKYAPFDPVIVIVNKIPAQNTLIIKKKRKREIAH